MSHEKVWKLGLNYESSHTKFLISEIKGKNIKKILDLGCGLGSDLYRLAKLGYDVYGIDLSPTAIKKTKEKLRKFKHLQKNFNKRFILHDMNKPLPFKQKFDAIISFSVLHHNTFSSLKKVLKIISNSLVKNGLLFVSIVDEKELKKINYKDKKFGQLYKFADDFWIKKKKNIYYPIYKGEIGTPTPEVHPDGKPVIHIFFNKKIIKKYFGLYFKTIKIKKVPFMYFVKCKK